MNSEKVFTGIESDYEFFMSHSTEARELLKYLIKDPLRAVIENSKSIVDFGGGDGSFTAELFQTLKLRVENLALIEPTESYRREWMLRLKPFAEKCQARSSLQECPARSVDLILANHVLYYVGKLAPILEAHRKNSAPGGKAIYTMASPRNALIELWSIGFGSMSSIPYNLSDELELELSNASMTFERTLVSSEVKFSDSATNREKLLRFLFKDNFSGFAMPTKTALTSYLDWHVSNGVIRLPLEDGIYLVSLEAQ